DLRKSMRSLLLFFVLIGSAGFAAKKEPPKNVMKSSLSPVYMGLYGGYGIVTGAYDGQAVQFRFTLGVDAWRSCYCDLGCEAAVQTGDTMALKAKQNLINSAGGMVPQAI